MAPWTVHGNGAGAQSVNIQTAGIRKVLFVAPEMEPRGTSEYTVNLATELKRRGVEVAVFCGPGPMAGVMRDRGIHFQCFARLESALFRCTDARRVLSAARAFSPQFVHGQSARVARVIRYLDRHLDAPMLLTVHCTQAKGAVLRRLARRLEGVIATTQDVREELVNDCRVDKAKIAVIRNGIDWDALATRKVPPILASSKPVVGSVGPVEQGRGHELFVKAAAELVHEGRDLHFVVAGQGDELPSLRRLARALGLDSRLTFVSDFAGYDEVLTAIDVVVQSSQVDVSGFSILEAMGYGRPVVAFSTGTACELIEDERTGILVPRRDVASLAHAIASLVDDPERARTMGRQAQETVAEKFNIRNVADATVRFYERLQAER